MIRKNILKIAMTLLLAIVATNAFSQIYDADFSTDDDGFSDHTSSSPPAAAPASVGPFGSTSNQWYLSYTSVPGSDTTANSFKVSGGSLVSDDWGGQGIFQSQVIDVSGINTVDISAITVNQGANDDSFTYFYILDGGSRVETDNMTSVNGDNLNYTITGLDVTGVNDLVVGFEFSENGGGHGYATSSFTVTNTTITGPTVGFDTETSTVEETNTPTTFNIPVSIVNYSSPVSITAVINGGTAEATDYTFTTNTASFAGNETKNLILTINDDADADDETVIIDITVTTGTATVGTSQHTVTITDDDTPPAPSLIITEVADIGDNAGARFIEIYNNGETDIDFSTTPVYISRFVNGDTTASSSNTEQLDSGILEAEGYLIIAASGTNFTSAYGFSADELNAGFAVNGDDPFGMYSGTYPSGTLFDVYGEIGVDGTGQSWEYENSRAVRNSILESPSTTWQASSWTISAANVADASPGASENEFRYDGAWKPRDISNATITDNVLVLANVTFANSLIINNFNVAPGYSIDLNTGVTINYFNSSVRNTIIKYSIELNTENWYLISSPVRDETTYNNDFIASNNLAINGTNNAIGTYMTETNSWSYMQTDDSGTFIPGIGYAVKRANGSGPGSISFVGTILEYDINVSAEETGYKLIGNPFNTGFRSGNFLSVNNTNGTIQQETLWLWNQNTGNYETKVTADSFILAPGQGFFVYANSGSQILFTELHRGGSGTFQKSSKTEVKLNITDGTNNRFAKMYYLNNVTKGFDNGYDGETFGGIVNKLDVFSHLVADSEGKNYQIQSLPNSDYENMVVPIGIIADANKEITFTAEALNLPTGIKVFLEDRLTNTFTRLDEPKGYYKVTLSENINGIGRFYLHTKSNRILSANTFDLDNISIYTTNNNTLRIIGAGEGKSTVKMFTILGKQVLNTSFYSNGIKEVYLPNLSAGIYVVQLNTATGQLNKKITLE